MSKTAIDTIIRYLEEVKIQLVSVTQFTDEHSNPVWEYEIRAKQDQLDNTFAN